MKGHNHVMDNCDNLSSSVAFRPRKLIYLGRIYTYSVSVSNYCYFDKSDPGKKSYFLIYSFS